MGLVTRAAVTVALLVALGAPPAFAAPFTVDSTADAVDANPGDGDCATAAATCTLRAAVQEANALAGADEIRLPAGTYEFAITGRGEDAAATGDLDVTETLSIVGLDAATTLISGKSLDRIFDVRSEQLSVRGAALEAGLASGSGDDSGGGLRTAPGTTLNLDRVRLGYNGAVNLHGRSLQNLGTAEMTRSSVQSVPSADSSWLLNAGTLVLENVTSQSGTTAVDGGTVTIRNSSLLGYAPNSIPTIAMLGGTVTATNSILGEGGPVCTGSSLLSGGHNLISDASCGLTGSGDQNAVDLGLRQENTIGGTAFFAPWPYGTSFDPPPGASCSAPLCPRLSRAVDAADAGQCPATDQIGTPRPQGPGCDIGAIEDRQADVALSVTGPSEVTAGQPATLTWTATNLGPSAISGTFLSLAWNDASLGVVAQDFPSECVHAGFTYFPAARCDLGAGLAPGASVTRTLTVSIPSADPPTRTFEAEGFADDGGEPFSTPRDPNTANNKASATMSVLPAPVVTPPATNPPPVVSGVKPCSLKKTGTRRANVLTGSVGPDLLRGLAGNDRLRGLAGDDCLDGGSGDDTLIGGSGRDKLGGGSGSDVVNAADHEKDTVDCGRGRDRATVDRIDRVKHCEKVKRKR